MFRRVFPIAVAIAAALVVAPAAANAAAKVRPGIYKLAIPAPGHVTVAALEVRALKHGRGRPPVRLSFSVPGRFSLPESVRIFYASRRLTGLRYELMFVAINRASGRRFQASAASTQVNAGRVVLRFPSRPSFGKSCGTCGKLFPRVTRCKSCWFKKTATRNVQAVNADTGSATDLAGLLGMLRAAWTTAGGTAPVFGDPAGGVPRDRTLSSGYYDDHRAFGWDRASLANTAPLMRTVVDELLSGQQQRLIPDLELIGQADLNANGQLDSAASPGGGTSA
jgi:hypothetical protein